MILMVFFIIFILMVFLPDFKLILIVGVFRGWYYFFKLILNKKCLKIKQKNQKDSEFYQLYI